MNKNPPYQSNKKMNILHFQTYQNKILNLTYIDDNQDEQNPHTPETLQIHNTYNTTMHDLDDLIYDKNDTSAEENTIEIETYEHYGEKIHETEESIPTETSQVLTVFNKTIHHEDDSSDYKSVIEIE